MRLTWGGRSLTIEIDDGSQVSPVIVPSDRRGSYGGLGLGLVEQRAEGPGTQRRPLSRSDRKSVV